MATEEIEISELEFTEELASDNLIPVESTTDTKATSLQILKNWLSSFFVGKTGKETISGEKTFKGAIIRSQTFSGASQYTIRAVDVNNKGSISIVPYYTGNIIYNRMLAENTTSGKNAFFDVIVRDDGTATIIFSGSATSKTAVFQGLSAFLVPTPSEGDNSQKAVNTAWVNTELANKKVMTAPDFSNKVEITSGYVAPSNGYVVAHNRSGDVNLRLYVEGLELGGVQTAHGGACSAFAVVAKGNAITYTGNNVVAYFVPCF